MLATTYILTNPELCTICRSPLNKLLLTLLQILSNLGVFMHLEMQTWRSRLCVFDSGLVTCYMSQFCLNLSHDGEFRSLKQWFSILLFLKAIMETNLLCKLKWLDTVQNLHTSRTLFMTFASIVCGISSCTFIYLVSKSY